MNFTKRFYWEKLGLVYTPNGSIAWSQSHAQVPVADFIEKENIIRIYFSTRDKENKSHPSYIEVNAYSPTEVVHINSEPLLSLGKIGTFDDCGVMPSWIIEHEQKKYLYYIGWNVRNTIPYHNSVGLAVSEDNGKKFKRFSEGPLWDRSHSEPHYSGTSCVIKDDGIWKNWYLSCTEWRNVNGINEPRYHIKYAESHDGINWQRDGHVAIDYKDSEEAGIVKASVIKVDDTYHMWFSYRKFNNYRTDKSSSYRIGYANSKDGKNWIRNDNKAGITISLGGWDSLMIEYPHVIKVNDDYYMFYNGNGFGQTGFGVAKLKYEDD